MLGRDRMIALAQRFLEVPPVDCIRQSAIECERVPIIFSVSMESVYSLLMDRFQRHSFFSSIGAGPMTILSYCTYKFWAERMQAPLGHIHDDVWCIVEEDIGTTVDSYPGEFTSRDQAKANAYLDAVMRLVDETYPYFERALEGYFRANSLFGNVDADLDISGMIGNVATFTLHVDPR